MEELKVDTSSSNSHNDTSCIHLQRLTIFILLIIIFLIIYFGNSKLKTNISNKQILYSQTSFINSSSSNSEFDVVLSYYSEDVIYVGRFIQYLKNALTLRKLKFRIILYNKNSKINITYLSKILKVDIIQQLPNLGREGGTYLYHIIENYHQLANHILFSQAGVEGITDTSLADWFSHRLEKQFNSSVGYMPLVSNNMLIMFDCGIAPGQTIHRLAELWGIIEETLCPPGGQVVAYRGQFLASGKRIRNRPLRVYQYINQILIANKTHWIHNDGRSQKFVQSTPDNPNFGHVVERLWTTLFNCSKPDLIDRCHRNECACFD